MKLLNIAGCVLIADGLVAPFLGFKEAMLLAVVGAVMVVVSALTKMQEASEMDLKIRLTNEKIDALVRSPRHGAHITQEEWDEHKKKLSRLMVSAGARGQL